MDRTSMEEHSMKNNRTILVAAIIMTMVLAATMTAVGASSRGNNPPDIVSDPITWAEAGSEYYYDVDAIDMDSNTLKYSLWMHPDGMIIDPDTGEIDWVPDYDQIDTHIVGVKVEDGAGATDTQNFTVEVYGPPPPWVEVYDPYWGEAVKGAIEIDCRVYSYSKATMNVTIILEISKYDEWNWEKGDVLFKQEATVFIKGDFMAEVSFKWDTTTVDDGDYGLWITVITPYGSSSGGRPEDGKEGDDWSYMASMVTVANNGDPDPDPTRVHIDIHSPYHKQVVDDRLLVAGKVISDEPKKFEISVEIMSMDGQYILEFQTGGVDFKEEFDISDAPSGEYVLYVTAIDPKSNAMGEAKVMFLVDHGPQYELSLYFKNPGDGDTVAGKVNVNIVFTCPEEHFVMESELKIGNEQFTLDPDTFLCPGRNIFSQAWDTTKETEDSKVELFAQVWYSNAWGIEDVMKTSITVLVNNEGNHPPYIDPIDDVSMKVGDTITIAVHSKDADGDPLTFMLIGPKGMNIDPSTGAIDFTAKEDHVGTHMVTVIVSDGEYQASMSFVLTVKRPADPNPDPNPDPDPDPNPDPNPQPNPNPNPNPNPQPNPNPDPNPNPNPNPQPNPNPDPNPGIPDLIEDQNGAKVDFKPPTWHGKDADYDWKFGDGTGSSDAAPSHTYGAPGTYTVDLTVTENGKVSKYSATVVVPEGQGLESVPQAEVPGFEGGLAVLGMIIGALVAVMVTNARRH